MLVICEITRDALGLLNESYFSDVLFRFWVILKHFNQ